jgi:hypothetical protein
MPGARLSDMKDAIVSDRVLRGGHASGFGDRLTASPHPARKKASFGGSFWGYLLAFSLIGIGWLVRDRELVDPGNGTGYWLGIGGAAMMLLLLVYPLRKRIRALRYLGATRHWFRAHMILGVAGPALVLYHCNFSPGSVNSKVALYSMLIVAGSGIVGRHLYARIHRGLYGEKASLRQLQKELAEALQSGEGIGRILPGLVSRLETLARELEGDRLTRSLGTAASIRWTVRRHALRLSLWFAIRRELRARIVQSAAIAADYARLRRAASVYAGSFLGRMGRVVQFTLYERLFSLWHVLHLPLFLMMVLAVVVHVLAVHMY